MRTLVALTSLTAAIGLAAPAHADPGPDASFLGALDKAGITYHSGPAAVAAAKQVCDWENQGQRRSDVISAISAGNPGFTMSSAVQFATLAEESYCPSRPPEPVVQAPPPAPPDWTVVLGILGSLPTPGAA